MTTAPDENVSDLIESLANNDIGSITEETVRSIVAYARQGSIERSTIPGVDLDNLPSGSTWQYLPEPNDGIQYTLLNKFATNYSVSSGLLTGLSTDAGLIYKEDILVGVTSNDVVQPRQVIVNWSIGLQSSFDSLWGVSWWRVPRGSTWPSGTGVWPGTATGATLDPISPLGVSLFGSALTSEETPRYVAPQSGSLTVTMYPGDTLVPALEYYGTLNSSGTDPQGILNSFIVKATTTGPVENTTEPDDAVNASINPGLDTSQAAIDYRDVFVASNVSADGAEVRKSVLIRADRPADSGTGTVVFNTAALTDGTPTRRLGIYGGPVAGWQEFESIQSPQSFTPRVMQNADATTRTGITVDTAGANFTARYVITGKLVNVWLTCSLSAAGAAGNAIRVELPVAPSTNLKTTSTIGNASIWDPTPSANRYHAVCEYNRTEQSVGSETYYHDCVFAVTQASAAAVGTTPAVTIASGDGIRMQLTYFTD